MMIGRALKRITVVPTKHSLPEGTQEPVRGTQCQPAQASQPISATPTASTLSNSIG